MKTCTKCRLDLDTERFSKQSRSADGLQSWCKDCSSSNHKTYYKNNTGKFIAAAAAYRARLRDITNAAKSIPCTDCGVQYPAWVMDFDHLPGTDKQFDVGDGVSHGFAIQRILDEIDKCDVICSNCHRQRTHNRMVPSSSGEDT